MVVRFVGGAEEGEKRLEIRSRRTCAESLYSITTNNCICVVERGPRSGVVRSVSLERGLVLIILRRRSDILRAKSDSGYGPTSFSHFLTCDL